MGHGTDEFRACVGTPAQHKRTFSVVFWSGQVMCKFGFDAETSPPSGIHVSMKRQSKGRLRGGGFAQDVLPIVHKGCTAFHGSALPTRTISSTRFFIDQHTLSAFLPMAPHLRHARRWTSITRRVAQSPCNLPHFFVLHLTYSTRLLPALGLQYSKWCSSFLKERPIYHGIRCQRDMYMALSPSANRQIHPSSHHLRPTQTQVEHGILRFHYRMDHARTKSCPSCYPSPA